VNDESAWTKALKQNPEAGNTQGFLDRPSRWPEKYIARVFDRSGTSGMNRSAQSENFEQILRDVRSLAAQYPSTDYAITLVNEVKVDQDFDGLTPEERMRFDEALQLGHQDRAAARGKRDLSADPELKDIDGRIASLYAMRGQLTDGARERWSALNNIHQEVSALMRVIQRATGRRP